MTKYRNPVPTADVIIEMEKEDGSPGIILVERKFEPPGWAIPGGFVEYGESLEEAAVREAKEETSLDVRLIAQLHTYSSPDRDPRKHTITTVFVGQAEGLPEARDDAKNIGIFSEDEIPSPLAFDHALILNDYFRWKRDGGFQGWPIMPENNDEPLKSDKYALKILLSVWGQAEAEVIKSYLESNGIPSFFKSHVVQSIHPFTMNGLGEIKIYVKEPDLDIATKLLEEMKPA